VIDQLSQIQDVYQRWLEGVLSQEDALFAIGDILQDPTRDALEEAAPSPACVKEHLRSSDG
jgi:hypothetical protein